MAVFGFGKQKPHHFREMLRVAWENRDQWPFAWRILSRGVCDGCALGTSGLADWTLPGVHLCMVRLELLRLNTAPALPDGLLHDLEPLRRSSSRELRSMGRLAHPMRRRRGARGFDAITWDEACDHIAAEVRATDPARIAVYLTSRGLTNEVYYAAQKAARFFGTAHVDNSARLCHAASTVAMKATLGHGAATCSYRDWLEADLIVLFGSNVANNQPVTTKYLREAKRRGAEIAVVNPYREPGLERYWIPSVPSSALHGTALADHWFSVHTGGDLAFLLGVLRVLHEQGGIDRAFVDAHTTGMNEACAAAAAVDWDTLVRHSGVSRDDMTAFATLLMRRPKAVLVWSMGLTQHAHGVDTVQALLNVGLARGLTSRAGAGLVPIRGHSGVQGGAEVGCSPAIDAATRRHWAHVWGFDVPDSPGWTANEMVSHAADGDVDLFWMVGGNFLETLGDEARSRLALRRPRLRIHHDIVLSSAMLADSDGDVLLLPAATRYESEGGGTETSTERRIIYSPEIPGRRIGSARPEWWPFGEVMRRTRPDAARCVGMQDAAAIRREIARAVPLYAGIETLAAQGDQVQWGGPRLFADGVFATSDGRAHARAVTLPPDHDRPARFTVSTRRGKQFNSMVQRDVDPLTGAERHDILISADDLVALGLPDRTTVTLRSSSGTFTGRLCQAPIRAGNLEVHWPEGNTLLDASRIDPASMEPDYNATVEIEPARLT